MIPRARRMVPGMLASLLLAVPLCAPRAQAATSGDAHGPAPGHAPGHAYAHAHHGHHHLLPRKVAEHPRRHHAARHTFAQRRRAPAQVHHAPAAPGPAIAFFDDGAPIRHQFWQQSGVASWYGGPRWQGRRTASGTRYEQDGFTAAHATLPLGSRVRVTLAGSGRSVVVTINDRPGTRTRVIDLSRGAARALGILDRGVARVVLTAAN